MEKTRLNELKNQMHEMRQKDLQISAKVDAKAINPISGSIRKASSLCERLNPM